MTHRFAKLLLLYAVVTTFGSAQQVPQQSLKFTLQQPSQEPVVHASIENAGKSPLLLDFGFLTGNRLNTLVFPDMIHLSLITATGQVLPLKMDTVMINILGQDGVIYLLPKTTFSFLIDLKLYAPSLSSGHYMLQATYHKSNAGTLGKRTAFEADGLLGKEIHLEPGTAFWDGTAISNTIAFTVP